MKIKLEESKEIELTDEQFKIYNAGWNKGIALGAVSGAAIAIVFFIIGLFLAN